MSEHLRPPSPDKILSTINLEAQLKSEGHFASAEVIHRRLTHEVKIKTRVDLNKLTEDNDQS